MNYYFEGTGLVSGYTPACLTWRSSPFSFAAGFLSSLRATAHPRTSRLWIRNLCDCWEWKRGAGGLRDSRHSPEDAVGLWFLLHTNCWLLLRKQIRLSGLITAGSAAATVNNNALFFCCCVSQCGADGLYSNCSVRTSAPRLSSLERGRPAHSAFLCSDSHITASMCVTGCDKQESLHSRLLWKQVNYPRGSRRKKCVGTKAERAPTEWVWSWISFCELSWGAAGEWNTAGRC